MRANVQRPFPHQAGKISTPAHFRGNFAARQDSPPVSSTSPHPRRAAPGKTSRPGRLPLYHFDVYRLGSSEELFEIGARDYFYGQGVCVIEWADLIAEEIPPGSRLIRISYGEEDGQRIYDIGTTE